MGLAWRMGLHRLRDFSWVSQHAAAGAGQLLLPILVLASGHESVCPAKISSIAACLRMSSSMCTTVLRWLKRALQRQHDTAASFCRT